MESVKISVSGNLTSVVVSEPLVAGTVGLPVMFSFDPSWQQLQKIAVFRVNGRTMDVLYNGQECPLGADGKARLPPLGRRLRYQ